MKNRYKSTFAWLGAMLLLVACTPDNPELGNIIPQSELNFSITQNPEKDNIIYLENKTAGIIPYWDWGILSVCSNNQYPNPLLGLGYWLFEQTERYHTNPFCG